MESVAQWRAICVIRAFDADADGFINDELIPAMLDLLNIYLHRPRQASKPRDRFRVVQGGKDREPQLSAREKP